MPADGRPALFLRDKAGKCVQILPCACISGREAGEGLCIFVNPAHRISMILPEGEKDPASQPCAIVYFT